MAKASRLSIQVTSLGFMERLPFVVSLVILRRLMFTDLMALVV